MSDLNVAYDDAGKAYCSGCADYGDCAEHGDDREIERLKDLVATEARMRDLEMRMWNERVERAAGIADGYKAALSRLQERAREVLAANDELTATLADFRRLAEVDPKELMPRHEAAQKRCRDALAAMRAALFQPWPAGGWWCIGGRHWMGERELSHPADCPVGAALAGHGAARADEREAEEHEQ